MTKSVEDLRAECAVLGSRCAFFRERQLEYGLVWRIYRQSPARRPWVVTDVVKVLYEFSISRCKKVNIDGFEFTWLEWPEYSDTALPVDHFVHTDKSMGVGAEVAPLVLQRG